MPATGIAGQPGAISGREHWPTGGLEGRELSEAQPNDRVTTE